MTRQSARNPLRKLGAWFSNLNQREKILLACVVVVPLCFAVIEGVTKFQDYREETTRQAVLRRQDLENTLVALKRYSQLNSRLKNLQASFDESRLTLGQVYDEVDRIVKESIGSDKYNLVKLQSAQPLGEHYEKQDYKLTIQSLTLEQLQRLLYELEQGKTPLFLRKVDLTKLYKKSEFQATLEIASLAKRKAESSEETST